MPDPSVPAASLEQREVLHQLRELVAEWREHARLVRPLESTPWTAQKRARTAEWMFYTNRANELEGKLAALSASPDGELERGDCVTELKRAAWGRSRSKADAAEKAVRDALASQRQLLQAAVDGLTQSACFTCGAEPGCNIDCAGCVWVANARAALSASPEGER